MSGAILWMQARWDCSRPRPASRARPSHVLSGWRRCSLPVRVIVPEFADYEVRRELLRAAKTTSVARLDALAAATEYLALTTLMMRRAAELWAQARQRGQPTAGDNTIDGDVILAAQALSLGADLRVVATTNVGHLSRFVPAELWQNVNP